jgi:hypothetical protein
VSLEIIRKPSIKPSPESGSIYVSEDQVSAQTLLSDSRAAVSELKGVAGQSSAAGSAKDSGAAVSKPAPADGQPDEAGTSTDPGAADPLVASVFHIREIPSWAEPFSNYLITGDLPQTKQKPGDSNAMRKHTPSSTASYTSATCQESSRNALSQKRGGSC